METKTKIFIVDDHEIVRCGLTQFINHKKNYIVCGEAADANSAIALINTSNPDIIIVDINLGGISGIELIKAIITRYGKKNIMALSMHGENEIVERALKAGARGYILKSDPAEHIIMGIEKIIAGETYISPTIKDRLFEKFIKGSSSDEEKSIELLTDREFEIFKLIAKGLNRREIAEQLSLNSSTIGTYRDRIKEKLDLKSSSELVKYAVEWSLRNEH